MLKGKTKLLVIDDEKAICEFTKNIFTKRGLDAYTAESGTKAITIAKKINPDIALIDVHMGKESGVDILKRLLKVSPKCRCIMVTWDKEKAQQAKKMGAAGILIKPAELKDLVEIVSMTVKKLRKK